MKKYAIGVDIGGTHISAAAIDLSNGKLPYSSVANCPLNNHASAPEILEVWSNTILTSINSVNINNVIGIGLAMPGPFDYLNGISLFNGETKKYENTYGINVADSLRHILKLPIDFPMRFVNDAAAFAIGEAWIGKSSKVKRSVAITIGTGLGSGFIKDGLPVFTGNKVPNDGFIWHLPFKEELADDYFSTRGLLKKYKKLKVRDIEGVKEIAEEANTDKNVADLFEGFGKDLALFLSPWLEKFGADVLVAGGSISKAFNLFENSMKRQFSDYGLKIIIEQSELNDTAQIAGAARLIDEDFWQKLLPELVKQDN